jgi:hypothetical protein
VAVESIAMIEWSPEHQFIREAVRRFIDAELKPRLDAIEHGGEPPYDVMRKLVQTFGLDQMARARFAKESASAASDEEHQESAATMAMQMIPIIEICRYSPGFVTALGVSMGLTARAILSRGTQRQKEEFALPLLTLEKIGAWAITEPGSGSDAFGQMKSTARRQPDGSYVLNGSKTFITNGPYADTIVFICKLDEDGPPEARKIVSFILDKGTPGLTQSKPLRKMGLHSSPTGELFLENVRVARDRLIGESEEAYSKAGAKETFTAERTGVAAMALGIVSECLDLSVEYAKTRVQFGRPIGEFQLIQLKLAKMQVARMNIQNIVFRQIEMAGAGKKMDLAEASACKLYCAQAAMETALEAVQLFGGNGYMSEFRVEQLCRDAKVLQIYGGTDEIQVSQIARSLLAR